METINHECYVSLEVAKLLKQAGFDWETFGYYNKLGFFHRAVPHNGETAAPTLEVAQRWLREVKNAHIEASPNSDMSAYAYNILLSWDKFWLCSSSSYSSYEEAQETGIKKALEIILEKGE